MSNKTNKPINMPKNIDSYKVLRQVGVSEKAQLYLAIDEQSKKQQKVVLKVFDQPLENQGDEEIEMIKKFNHKNIIGYVNNGVTEIANESGSKEQVNYLVMEYGAKGDLYDYIANTGSFSEELARFYTVQLMNGLRHMYDKGHCHRDIKLENLMINDKYQLKITDFDTVANIYGDNNCGLLSDYCGTRQYMAPELLAKDYYVGEKVDMFALGAMLFMMVTGSAAFVEANRSDERYKFICRKQYAKFWAFYDHEEYSEEFKSLIEALLNPESEKRPTLSDLNHYPWFKANSGEDLTKKEAATEMANRYEMIALQEAQ